jgi:ribonuclease HI
MEKVAVYTDGSSLGNPGPGGAGAVILYPNDVIEIGAAEAQTTNNRMELLAVILSLQKCHQSATIHIFSDSQYVLSGITQWIHGWKKNGWKTASKKPVLNQDLWMQLDALVQSFPGTIIWEKVLGHSGVIYNERADRIANEYALHGTATLYHGSKEGYEY